MAACACEGDPFDLKVDAMRRAKKLWRCDECGKPIQPGDEYRLIQGRDSDGPIEVRQCSFCARVAKDLAHNGFCYALGDLWQMVEQIECEES